MLISSVCDVACFAERIAQSEKKVDLSAIGGVVNVQQGHFVVEMHHLGQIVEVSGFVEVEFQWKLVFVVFHPACQFLHFFFGILFLEFHKVSVCYVGNCAVPFRAGAPVRYLLLVIGGWQLCKAFDYESAKLRI